MMLMSFCGMIPNFAPYSSKMPFLPGGLEGARTIQQKEVILREVVICNDSSAKVLLMTVYLDEGCKVRTLAWTLPS